MAYGLRIDLGNVEVLTFEAAPDVYLTMQY